MNKHSFLEKSQMIDKIMTRVFWLIGILTVGFLVILTCYILFQGIISFYPGLLSGTSSGILNQLFNTVYLVFLSLLISTPIGICAGIYLSEYAKDNYLTHFLEICIESLSSLPSIVVGLFGYLIFIVLANMKWNLFAGALAVSILCIPLITTETHNALKKLPQGYREGSLALGATKSQTIKSVLIPASFHEITTGIIMAAGRGFGEAAALLYTAGQSTNINWSNWNILSPTCPLNPFRPGETLALHIWVMRTEGSLNPNATQIANFSSMILVIMTFVFSYLARRLSKK